MVNEDEFQVIAYFTLAMKPFALENLSIDNQIEIRGTALAKNATTNSVAAILIGQIGKNDLATMPISSNALFHEVFLAVKAANEELGSRIVYLDCCDHPKLRHIYESKGFTLLQNSDGTCFLQSLSSGQQHLVYVMGMDKLYQILDDNPLPEVQ